MSDSGPKWMKLALHEFGTLEVPGPGSNPTIVQYYEDAIHEKEPDDVPWCAAFVGAMLSRAGVKPSGSLLARSYLKWGTRLSSPVYGAVVVFSRGRGMGHVAFFIRDEGATIKVLGGNQSDAVTVANYSKSHVIGYRWPLTG